MRNATGHGGDKLGSGLINCMNKYCTPNDFKKVGKNWRAITGLKKKSGL